MQGYAGWPHGLRTLREMKAQYLMDSVVDPLTGQIPQFDSQVKSLVALHNTLVYVNTNSALRHVLRSWARRRAVRFTRYRPSSLLFHSAW